MKMLFKIFLMVIITIPVFAQDDDLPQEADPKVRDKIRAAHVAYLTTELGLTPEEAEKFWPIYNEFLEKRKTLHREFRQKKQNPDPNKTEDQNSKDLVDLGFKVKQQELDMEREYSGRLLKVISAQKLRTLPEAEKRFRQMIIDQIQRRQMQRERREQMQDRSQQRLQHRNN